MDKIPGKDIHIPVDPRSRVPAGIVPGFNGNLDGIVRIEFQEGVCKSYCSRRGAIPRNRRLHTGVHVDPFKFRRRIQPASATPPHLAKTSAGVLKSKRFIVAALILLTTCLFFSVLSSANYGSKLPGGVQFFLTYLRIRATIGFV
jgi:hypothetical protein